MWKISIFQLDWLCDVIETMHRGRSGKSSVNPSSGLAHWPMADGFHTISSWWHWVGCVTSQLPWCRWRGSARWGGPVWSECLQRAGVRANGISAAEESRDLAAICLLVGLKVGNDPPNSCGKHFRWRLFSSAEQTEVQQHTEAGTHPPLLLLHSSRCHSCDSFMYTHCEKAGPKY